MTPSPPEDEWLEYLKMLMIWSADFQMALSAITFLDEVEEDRKYSIPELRRFRCYETAFIVAYCRPFTRAKGTKFSRLVLPDVGLALTDKESEMHQRIRQLRDKVFAHSDTDFAHVRLDSHKLNSKRFTFTYPHIQANKGVEFSDFLERLQAMELCSKIFHAVYKKLMELDRLRKDRSPIYMRPPGHDQSTDGG